MERHDYGHELSAQTAREGRPGCLPARVGSLVVRLVLVVAPLVMGAQVGRWLCWRMDWGQDAAFALAITGALAGGLLGLGLAVRGTTSHGGRGLRSDVVLCLLACVFLVRAALGWVQPLGAEEVGIAYLAVLSGAFLVWLLG